MEIFPSENVDSKSVLVSVQSVPILSNPGSDDKNDGTQIFKDKKKRRVSFASTQLAQYLEPLNPFESLGEFKS